MGRHDTLDLRIQIGSAQRYVEPFHGVGEDFKFTTGIIGIVVRNGGDETVEIERLITGIVVIEGACANIGFAVENTQLGAAFISDHGFVAKGNRRIIDRHTIGLKTQRAVGRCIEAPAADTAADARVHQHIIVGFIAQLELAGPVTTALLVGTAPRRCRLGIEIPIKVSRRAGIVRVQRS